MPGPTLPVMPGLTGHLLHGTKILCNFVGYMIKRLLLTGLALAALVACKQKGSAPREAIGLVQSIVEDTTGVREIVAKAGRIGADGSIALLGEPADVARLAAKFQAADRVDNVDGREKPDSLRDFAGETIDALLDAYNAPYCHFAQNESLDSLREVAVRGALHAWDTVCYRSATDHRAILKKASAKILIFSSSLQTEYGVFDVDTLQQLLGGKSRVLSPVNVLLEDALAAGAQNLVVWASPAVKEARVWEKALAATGRVNVTLAAYTPEQAVDVRTRFRNVLRQYQVTGLPLDALIIDDYQVNLRPLETELALIRLCGTEEDTVFDQMLGPQFRFLNPADAVIRATYNLLRKENLFAHKIAQPVVKYYESAESASGDVVLVEAAASYVKDTYVPELY